MNSIIRFIRYNNAVPIAFSLVVFLAVGTFAASPEARESIGKSLVSSQSAVRSVDNTKLLAADIADLEFKPQIAAVNEDGENYYIEYSYRTFQLEDYIWQVKKKFNKLTVSKDALGARDLGDYVAKELKEVIDYERLYLADTQKIEMTNGVTRKVVATTYSGLIGKFFDEKQETFPGYIKVVNAPEPIAVPSSNSAEVNNPVITVFAQAQISKQVTSEYIRSIVKELLDQAKASNNYDNGDTAIGDGGQQSIVGDVRAPDDSVSPSQNATTTADQNAAVRSVSNSPVAENQSPAVESQSAPADEGALPSASAPSDNAVPLLDK